jgi:hypothetical protein
MRRRSTESAHERRVFLASALGWLGVIAFEQSRPNRARELTREALQLIVALDARMFFCYALELAAALEIDDPASATRLLGAAAGLQEDVGHSVEVPAFRRLCKRTRAALHERLDPEAFESFWAEGATMNPKEAVAYALEGPLRTSPAHV